MAATPMQSVSKETALHPKLPLRLGRFTLCEELGSGGMATVYLARMNLAAGLERLVALKTIHPHLSREKPFVDMFLDEARIASHISHQNVCAVHDFGEMDGVYYLAMEHLIGEPLFDVINRMVDRFDEVKEVLPYIAARVIADACEGLYAAHTARGPDGKKLSIVHRDVSPQNLFITYDGSVKIVDFGCAKAAQRVAHTSTGVMKGKVGYAAPEQLRADDVDHRADVWALGVCLWEALTLSPLFTKDTAMATAMSVLDAPIQNAATDRDWVPQVVATIAEKALYRNREDRYENARDMGRDLRKFIADSGYTLEAAEIAEWMSFLFEDKHAEREQQATRVREMDISDVEPARPELLSHEDVVLLDDQPQPNEVIPTPDDEDEEEEHYVPGLSPMSTPPALPVKTERAAPPPHEEAKPASRAWIVALAVGAVVLVVGYYVNLYYEPAPWLQEMVGLGSSTVEEPAPDPTPTTATRTENERPETPTVGAPSQAPTKTAETPQAQPSTEEPRPRRRNGEGGGGGSVVTVVSGGGMPIQTPTQVQVQQPPPSTNDPAPATTQTGTVRIEATGGGWATISSQGRALGRTPLVADLPVGRHRLRVQPFGHEPTEFITVDVEAGVEQSLTIEVSEPPSGGGGAAPAIEPSTY